MQVPWKGKTGCENLSKSLSSQEAGAETIPPTNLDASTKGDHYVGNVSFDYVTVSLGDSKVSVNKQNLKFILNNS